MVKEYACTTKDLGYRTKFPTSLINKILKELASYNLVKSVKRPESKNMNVWVLYGQQVEEDGQREVEGKEDLM